MYEYWVYEDNVAFIDQKLQHFQRIFIFKTFLTYQGQRCVCIYTYSHLNKWKRFRWIPCILCFKHKKRKINRVFDHSVYYMHCMFCYIACSASAFEVTATPSKSSEVALCAPCKWEHLISYCVAPALSMYLDTVHKYDCPTGIP